MTSCLIAIVVRKTEKLYASRLASDTIVSFFTDTKAKIPHNRTET